MVLSQILRFTLPNASSATSTPAFLRLRDFVRLHGQVKEQYFGYVTSVAERKTSNEMCWIIQWPNGSELRKTASFKTQLTEVTRGENTKSLLFEFDDSQEAELRKGLESPVTEFAFINLSSTAPLQNADLKHSMHKTFTDCYYQEGFTGGNWAYSVNTNNTEELLGDGENEQVVPVEQRRLACYYLGWESIDLHQAASRTALFDEEIDKLMPWFGPGTQAWYVFLNKH